MYCLIQELKLLYGELVMLIHLDCKRVLVGIVVQVDEAVVEKEARVALFAIGVINLFATLDILESLDDETLTFVSVGPAGLPWTLVIEHVSVCDEAIGLNALNLNSKDSTGYHHTHLRVLLKGELAIIRHLAANCIVVLLNVTDFLRNLILEWTSLKPCSLLLGVKNGEVVEGFGQNVNVLVKDSHLFTALLHNIGRQEGVFW